MKILVVEDEHRIANSIKQGLEQEHYTVDVAYTGIDGYDLASSENYDLLILDLMLPGLDGLSICQKLRAENKHLPILILTAKSQINDKIAGLDNGADDYLTKPFSFDELLARIRALIRRPQTITSEILKFQNITLNLRTFEVKVGNRIINLSSKEFSLLEMLLRHPDTILTKEQIINHVWDYESDVLPNTIEVYIKKLRQKLGEKSIITIRGFGYKLVGDHV